MGALLQVVRDLKTPPKDDSNNDHRLVRYLASMFVIFMTKNRTFSVFITLLDRALANLAIDTVHYSDFPLNDSHLSSLLSLLFSSVSAQLKGKKKEKEEAYRVSFFWLLVPSISPFKTIF